MRRKWCRRAKIGKHSEAFLLPTDLPDVQLFTVIWHPPKVQEAVRYHYPAARIRRPGDIGHRPLRCLWIIVQVHGSEKRFQYSIIVSNITPPLHFWHDSDRMTNRAR